MLQIFFSARRAAFSALLASFLASFRASFLAASLAVGALLLPQVSGAAPPAAAAHGPADPAPAASCAQCGDWNSPQPPFRIYGNTYYVGTHGLTALLITSPQGHILIDGALAQSAPQIAASIRTLGFKLQDIKLLLNSHVHFDHAGGLGELQRLSGAAAAASAPAAAVLSSGHSGADDPQYGSLPAIAPLSHVAVVVDGQSVHAGPLALQAHLTPGHTPGGTTWTCLSCEQGRCVHMVYADSLTAVAAPGYRFTAHPQVVASFERSFRTLEQLPCEVLVTPHPEVSAVWSRLQDSERGGGDAAFIDPQACRSYAARSREGLRQRLASEGRPPGSP